MAQRGTRPASDRVERIVGESHGLFHGALVRALGYGAAQQQKLLTLLVVKEIMATDVVTTTPETPLEDAARTMLDRKIGCLPVLDGDRLVGILTEGDFVAFVARPDSSSR